MEFFKRIENHTILQYLLGTGSIIFISLLCYLWEDLIGYHAVALLLLLTVSILAMLLDTFAIVVTAVLSALIWNFLFLQPRETFKIHTPEDVLLFFMYAVIVVMNAVFTSRIRKVERVARQKKEREKTLELYNTLINSLSHELKTPISTIIGAVDTLKMDSRKLSAQNRLELIKEIDIAGNRLHQQVGNLLNMSRLESDFFTLQRDWYDLNELVHQVVEKNEQDAARHEVVFIPDENLPLFKLDGPLLEQVLNNLLHNALLYTPAGTRIEIAVHSTGSGLELTIRDNGPGFPEDKLGLVFDSFYRLPKTKASGTGLGLSIAQGFVKAHNGSITLKNVATGGAKFVVNIPAENTKIEEHE